jgi:hypothetical protein
VDILAFVELADIQPQYFDTPYYLKPEKARRERPTPCCATRWTRPARPASPAW